jgi:hypothetical protein
VGYTHYWKVKEMLEVSPKQRELIDEVLKEHADVLEVETNTNRELVLNGIEENSHETFAIEFGKKVEFEFCKTARKPYDIPVCKILLILRYSKGFELSSDGDIDEKDIEGDTGWAVANKWLNTRLEND